MPFDEQSVGQSFRSVPIDLPEPVMQYAVLRKLVISERVPAFDRRVSCSLPEADCLPVSAAAFTLHGEPQVVHFRLGAPLEVDVAGHGMRGE